jgi:hypothetical protein
LLEFAYSDNRKVVVDIPSLAGPQEIHKVVILPDLLYLQLPRSRAPFFLLVADQRAALAQSSYYHMFLILLQYLIIHETEYIGLCLS